jgi:hypothetical protein
MAWKNYRNKPSITQVANPVDEFNEENDLTSAFNEQKFEMIRLHVWWEKCDRAAFDGNFDKWRWAQDIIWRMFVSRACQIEPEIYVNENEKLERRISEAIRRKNKRGIYEALSEREIFLRLLEAKVGLGSNMKDSMDDIQV